MEAIVHEIQKNVSCTLAVQPLMKKRNLDTQRRKNFCYWGLSEERFFFLFNPLFHFGPVFFLV